MEPFPEKGPKLRRGLQIFSSCFRGCANICLPRREGAVVGLRGVVGRCCCGLRGLLGSCCCELRGAVGPRCCDGLWESGNPPPVRPLSGHQLTAALGGMQKGENAEKDKYEVLRYALDRPQMAYISKIWSNYLN